MTQNLENIAHELADYLTDEVLYEETITGLNILESLASLGYTLKADPKGKSSIAYYQYFKRQLR